jgi:hypothetical protein
MAQTRRFHALRKRVAELETELIPATKPLGDYTQLEQDLIRAYRLLVHAECEHYFEQVTLEIANGAFSAYKKYGRVSRVLRALKQSFCRDTQLTTGSDIFESVVKSFQKLVASNNGIKEYNLCRLILPLGTSDSLLDRTWLGTMNSFGQKRGDVAHKAAAVANVADPVTETSLIKLVMTGIQTLDTGLQKR